MKAKAPAGTTSVAAKPKRAQDSATKATKDTSTTPTGGADKGTDAGAPSTKPAGDPAGASGRHDAKAAGADSTLADALRAARVANRA